MIDNTLNNFLFRRYDGMSSLKTGLDALSLRHKIISANVANAETPGYKAKKVVFEEKLRRALRTSGNGITATNKNHISMRNSIQRVENVRTEIVDDDTPPNYNGINNVDIDMQMAHMGTNQIQYALASRVMKMRYELLQKSIRGS